MGLVVFQIDHYAARKIKYDKTFSKVSGITFMNDAYAALKLLKTNPKIRNVGYLGWSQGGVGPILSHFKFVNNLMVKLENALHQRLQSIHIVVLHFQLRQKLETQLLMITVLMMT